MLQSTQVLWASGLSFLLGSWTIDLKMLALFLCIKGHEKGARNEKMSKM